MLLHGLGLRMNKVLATIGTLAAVFLVYFLLSSGTSDVPGEKLRLTETPSANKGESSTKTSNDGAAGAVGSGKITANDVGEEDGIVDSSDRPATELYSSAAEALEAIRKGAKSYDDIVLEQFVNPGKACSWCDELYSSVRSLVSSTAATPDERSYYAELLAISGRPENIEELIKNIESASSTEDGDLYTEALEIAVGDDTLVNFLNDKLTSTDNKNLKENIVAAISNQGSARTVEALYDFTKSQNNPDGFYSEGTGLGELIPEEGAFPALKDIVAKRDEYSHLGVKALLNGGLEGVRAVNDLLSSSNATDKDKELLKNAADHVSFDEETEQYFKDVVVPSSNPALSEWGKEVLASFSEETTSDTAKDDAN